MSRTSARQGKTLLPQDRDSVLKCVLTGAAFQNDKRPIRPDILFSRPASSYDIPVFKFIALEHRRKNQVILAVERRIVCRLRRSPGQRATGIREQAPEWLLQADGLALAG
jgi:hypothetical protein